MENSPRQLVWGKGPTPLISGVVPAQKNFTFGDCAYYAAKRDCIIAGFLQRPDGHTRGTNFN